MATNVGIHLKRSTLLAAGTALLVASIATPAHASDPAYAAYRLAQFFGLVTEPVNERPPLSSESPFVDAPPPAPADLSDGSEDDGGGNTLDFSFRTQTEQAVLDGSLQTEQQGGAFVNFSLYTGWTGIDIDRTGLVAEVPVGTGFGLVPAVNLDTEPDGYSIRASGNFCGGDRDLFYDGGPQCLGLAIDWSRVTDSFRPADQDFVGGLGIPAVGDTPGVYFGRPGVSATVDGQSYSFDQSLFRLEMEKVVQEYIFRNGFLISLFSGLDFSHQSTEERYSGTVRFTAAPTTFANFDYRTDVDMTSYGFYVGTDLTWGTPISPGVLGFVQLGVEGGLSYASLDGTDAATRNGAGGAYAATSSLDDEAWIPRAAVEARVGSLFTHTGVSASVYGRADFGDNRQFDVYRPDSTPGGQALQSYARIDDGWADEPDLSVGVNLSIAIPVGQ